MPEKFAPVGQQHPRSRVPRRRHRSLPVDRNLSDSCYRSAGGEYQARCVTSLAKFIAIRWLVPRTGSPGNTMVSMNDIEKKKVCAPMRSSIITVDATFLTRGRGTLDTGRGKRRGGNYPRLSPGSNVN